MSAGAERLGQVRERIARACSAAGRHPDEVTLLAVSKRHPPELIRAFFGFGQKAFGENRLQEAQGKMAQLTDIDIEWHFIGPIQSNKAHDLATAFDWVQSVDRLKVLRKLAEFRPPDRPPLNICLQVNIDREPQKAGVDPDRLGPLVEEASRAPALRLRGLMAIPMLTDDPRLARDSFRRMRALFTELQQAGLPLDTLSMGMSADLELAIAEGSTMVRVGTDLLGPRPDDHDTGGPL